MKTWFRIMLVLLVAAMPSCSNNYSSDLDCVATTESLPFCDVSIQYLCENSVENTISVEIPVFVSKEYQPLNKCIYDVLIDRIQEMCQHDCKLCIHENDCIVEEGTYTCYYIDVDAHLTLLSDDVVSIVFEGIFNKKSTAHPTNILFSVNLDVENGTLLDFGSCYDIDDELYQIFSTVAESNLLQECDGIWPEGWPSFSEGLCSKEDFLNGLRTGEEISWYYTECGVEISYAVPHTLGDHKEVLIPLERLHKAGS